MSKPTHIDLFSGIGAFSLAARWAGFETILHCEIDPYCQRVLEKNFPEVPIHGDVHTLRNARFADLLTGGHPCQPFSGVGEQRDFADDRDLWPEMFRCITEIRPTWVVAENVERFSRVGLDRTLSDLEGAGYAAGSLVFPALAVGAQHRRQRTFTLAYAGGKGLEGSALTSNAEHLQVHQDILSRYDRPSMPRVLRGGHGIPHALDQIRVLGNAIVPQQCYPILKLIADNIIEERAA